MTTQDVMRTNGQLAKYGDAGTQAAPAIDDMMLDIEQRMFDIIDSDVDILRDASRHILEAGGKRVRPRLVLLSFLANGGTDIQPILSAAAALELVHTASVVHDDINDHGVMRRGRPSVNQIWGRTFALLTGDFLFTKVYELMADYGPALNSVFSEATTALVEGETLQAAAVKEGNLNREIYMKIIALKTAALFKAGGMIGAMLAKANPQAIDAMGRYGYNIGLAFQIVDDILDLTADAEQLGKTAGLDAQQGKGLSSVSDSAEPGEAAAFESIKQKALSGDRIAEGRAQAQHLVTMAIAELVILPDNEARQGLITLAQLIVNREK
ncbi:polyprenyl synthetase family protein [bacterium]|nr:polyprenyl synthetase family protein [bacterium]